MHWTVSRRIATGFVLMLALVLIVAVSGVVALGKSAGVYRLALAQESERVVPALRAQSDFRRARVEHLRFLISPQSAAEAAMDSMVDISRNLLTQLRDSSAMSDPDRQDWEGALRHIGQWEESARASMVAARTGNDAEAVRIRDTHVATAADSARLGIDRGVEKAQNQGQAFMAAGAATSQRLGIALSLGGLLALVVGTIAGVLLNRAVSDPLRETTGVLASSAAEILAATTQQASGASESSAAVAETMSTVDEVSQTAEQAAQRAKAVADSSRRAAEIGAAGRRAVDASAEGMTAVKMQVESIAASILALAEQAQAIGEIIATVNDIAEQTNLLALNAAVEAARAGDQGRGFAVVAGEVKNLAQQSKKATVQVRQILGDIQRATSGVVMSTEQGTKQVTATGKQVTEAGETIRTLAEAVTEAAQSAAQIVASAGQQAAGMGQIREAMGSIHQATQQNLASTKQSERAAQDLNALGIKLLDLVGGARNGGVGNRGK